jgi:hypothetical protein
MIQFTFDNNFNTKKFILGIFGKDIDDEGYIIEREGNKRILGYNGQEMTVDEFGGIKNGSEIYVKSDIVSLVGFYEKYLSETK